MGCWGITAFESDAGLDAVGMFREHLSEDGRLELEHLIEALQKDDWNAPPDVRDGQPHTSAMALAEMIVKFLDQDMGGLDYDEDWAAQDRKFSTVTSFSASKESIRWLHGYISDTLRHARKNAAQGHHWGGWFKKEDWLRWQKHMEELAGRLDVLLAAPENRVQLIPPLEQKRKFSEGGSRLEDVNAARQRISEVQYEKGNEPSGPTAGLKLGQT